MALSLLVGTTVDYKRYSTINYIILKHSQWLILLPLITLIFKIIKMFVCVVALHSSQRATPRTSVFGFAK